MKDTVLFDLGGTLVRYYERDEFPSILRQAISEVRDYLQQEGVQTAAAESIWPRVREEDYEAADHRVRPLERRLVRIFQFPADAQSDALLVEMCRCFMRPISALARCYEDAVPTLEGLRARGFGTGIVSNTPWGSPAGLWHEEMARLGLADRVDVVVFCGDVGWRKPAPQVFEFALDRLQVSGDRCIFVGDDPRWDVVGPGRAGIDPVLIDRCGADERTGKVTIRGLHELWNVFRACPWQQNARS